MFKQIVLLCLFMLIVPSVSPANDCTLSALNDSASSFTNTTRSALMTSLMAPKAKLCKEACWAQSASDRELREKYGSAKIPARFKFADRFYRKGEAVYMSCMRPHGPMGVMNKAISRRCTEKSNRVCTEACKAALSK